MAGMGKSFLASDNGGVLAGPLVQLAAGGKPSIEGLADPLGLFHNKSTPDQSVPAIPAAPVQPADPVIAAATAKSTADNVDAQRKRALSLNTLLSDPSNPSSGVASYG